MCGIAGVIDVHHRVNVKSLEKMTSIVNHRGPDDEGFYLWHNNKSGFYAGNDTAPDLRNIISKMISEVTDQDITVGFGHRRLSIIDLSSNGHQPMRLNHKVLIFNGEIYNYLELRDSLMLKGINFDTETDSEVLLRAYEHWGEACVQYFDGMWSFAIWDELEQALFCSRDRFGEKPFYYFFDESTFIFGSEIKQLLAYGVPFEVNESMLHNFLFYYNQIELSNETYFKNIKTLRASHNLHVNMQEGKTLTLLENRYFELKKRPIEEKNYAQIQQRIGTLLEESIKLRLRTDVSIGSCLSGGLDSSSIVTLATKQIKANHDNSNFKTYTAMYDENPEVDERKYSQIVTKETQSENFEVKPSSKELRQDFSQMVWHQEEPFPGLSIFASWRVMKDAQKENTVVLFDGQGGDETFLGYTTHLHQYLQDYLSRFRWIKFFKELNRVCENNNLPKFMTLYTVLRHKFHFFVGYRSSSQLALSLNPGYLKKHGLKKTTLRKFKSLNELQKMDLENYIQSLLRYEDRNAMAHSIETRLPFLSHSLVEYCYSLSNDKKIVKGWTKALLRSYMEDKMPSEIVYRKNKLGFAVPQARWLNELLPWIEEMFETDLLSEKYFNIPWIKENYEDPAHASIIFKFLMIEQWLRVFSKKEMMT